MLRPRVWIPFSLLLAATAAQTPSWSPEHAIAGLGGTVLSFSSFQGDLHAGGEWFAAKGGQIRGLARWDGVAWRSVGGGVDLAGRLGFNTNPGVHAQVVWNNDLYFAGTFDRVGTAVIHQVARWNGTTSSALGAGLRLSYYDARVAALAVYGNELYATGEFDAAGGQPVASIARWDGTTWRPLGTGLTNSLNGTIGIGRALHVHGGQLWVGGEFDRAGGLPVGNIAVWNGSSWSSPGAGAAYTVRALETWNNNLVAAAQFQFGSGVEMLGQWNGSTWSPVGQGGPTLPCAALRAVGSKLYAGGVFTQPGPQLAMFDGQQWRDIGGVAGVGPSVAALHRHGTELVVGGEFTNVGPRPGTPGSIGSANVAALDATDTWHGLGTGFGVDRPLTRIVRWRAGLVAVGGFTEAGTVRSSGLVFHDGDRWTMLGEFDGAVSDAVVYRGDLVVTGAFTRIDGQGYNGIARHDGTQWGFFTYTGPAGLCVHGNDLYASGGQALRRFDGTTFVNVAPVQGIVNHMLSHRDGNLYLTTDNAFQHFVYRWNGAQLTRIGTPNDFNQCLASHGNDVVLGGRFTAVDGTAANLMARWNGTSWSALPGVTGYATYAFAELDGLLYAAVSGEPRGMTLRLQGNTWQAVGTPPNGVPTYMAPDRAVGSLLTSGDWFEAGTLPCRNLAEWRTQPAWTNRQHGLAGTSAVPPLLLGRGTLQAGTTVAWTIEAQPAQAVLFGLGTQRVDQALRGGILVPSPDAITFLLTDANGTAALSLPFPAGIPTGSQFFSQAWLIDATGPAGLTATNALQCTAP